MTVINQADVERVRQSYPELSELEIHAINMKREGARDGILAANGDKRPVAYLWDDGQFVLTSFMFNAEDSPYSIRDERILFDENELPFNNLVFARLGNTLPYWYFRGPFGLFPTMNAIPEERNMLNTNFHPRCNGCDESGLGDLSAIDQIAVVTGRFPTEEQLMEHILDVIRGAKNRGWNGHIFYIGSQIVSPEVVKQIVAELGGVEKFKYAYTVERFTDREAVMHGSKGRKNAGKILEDLRLLRGLGISRLEYIYIVGIEGLDDFRQYAEEFARYARPHISLLRRTGIGKNNLTICNEYQERGVEYVADMRRHWHALYNGPVIGNNFANAWPFPLDFDINHYIGKLEPMDGSHK